MEGRLHLDTWDDKDTGNKRSKLKVIGENVQFIGNGGGDGAKSGTNQHSSNSPDSEPQYRQADGQAPQNSNPQNQEVPEDDIPF